MCSPPIRAAAPVASPKMTSIRIAATAASKAIVKQSAASTQMSVLCEIPSPLNILDLPAEILMHIFAESQLGDVTLRSVCARFRQLVALSLRSETLITCAIEYASALERAASTIRNPGRLSWLDKKVAACYRNTVARHIQKLRIRNLYELRQASTMVKTAPLLDVTVNSNLIMTELVLSRFPRNGPIQQHLVDMARLRKPAIFCMSVEDEFTRTLLADLNYIKTEAGCALMAPDGELLSWNYIEEHIKSTIKQDEIK
jgi:hypothetical protein